jgi:hypothetical protein
VTFDLLTSNGTAWTIVGGDDADEGLITDVVTSAVLFNTSNSTYFIASDKDARETHLVEVTKIDDTNGVTFKDVATGTKYENKKAGTFTMGDVTITVGAFDETAGTVTVQVANGDAKRVYTEEGLTIILPDVADLTGSSYELQFLEEDINDNLEAGSGFNLTLSRTASAKASVSGTTVTIYEKQPDTDEFVGYVTSALATKIEIDKGSNQDTATITYHGTEAYGNVYISEVEAGFGTTVIEGDEIACSVGVPFAKLDEEITNVNSQNMIVVGGPCANSVAAEIMGVSQLWPECGSEFEEGKGKIKLYELENDKYALLIAGMSALDTRRATRVMANYNQYDLTNSEVEVIGTTLDDISIVKIVDEEE